MEQTMHLTLPEQTGDGRRRFKTGRAAIQQWLRELPVGDPAEASREIYQQLAASNRLPLRARQRLRFLQQLHQHVEYCVAGLRRQYQDRELPVTGTPRRIANLSTRLVEEMALGHEIALEQLRNRRISRKRIAKLTVNAIHYRGLVLRECWLIYEGAPAGTWQRLHQLYQIASEHQILQCRVRNAGDRHRRTPAMTYKHAALTAAAGPLQLDRGEVLTVWWLISQWADSSEISPLDEDGEEVFRLPRHDDRPPHPGISGLNRPDDRFLRTTPLLRRVRHETRQTRSWRLWRRPDSPAAAYPKLTEQLLIALAAVPARQHRRVRVSSRIQGVLGMSQGHQALSEELGLPVIGSDTKERAFQSRNTKDSNHRERDVWDMIHPDGVAQAIEDRLKVGGASQRQRADTTKGRDNAHPRPEPWQMVNISPGGYCLLAHAEHPHRARVGELMVVRENASKGRPWQLAAVRWLRGLDGKGLQVGVQIVGTNPQPVMLRAKMDNGRSAPPERGFVLPGSSRHGKPSTVMTPGPHYRADRLVALRYGQLQAEIRLVYCWEGNNHFGQWEFDYPDPLSVDSDFDRMLSEGPTSTAS